MTEKPLVSIYLPTHGRPQLVERAVRSALAQTYAPLEVVVVVDGPDAETAKALSQFADDPRLSVHLLPARGGACAARNWAIEHARGELVTGLDDDDELLPPHVANLVDLLSTSRAAFACTTNRLLRRGSFSVRHAFSGPIPLDRLLEENVVGNQLLTPRTSLLDVGGFDPEMPAWQDYDLWVRLCRAHGAGIRGDFQTYLQHADHGAERISQPDKIEAAHRKFVQKHAELLTPENLLSLELLMYATSHRPFPLRRGIEYVRAGFGKRTLEAVLSDRLPLLRTPARRLRSLLSGHHSDGPESFP